MKRTLPIILLLCAASAFAADEKEAYCAYVLQQADAQKIFFRTPSIEGGVSQEPISSGVPQIYAGVLNSISGDRKARLLMIAAAKDCALFGTTTDAKLRIQFDLVSINKQVLQGRIVFEQAAIQHVDAIVAEAQKLVQEQNISVPTLYTLEETRAKLEIDIANCRLLIASLYTPILNPTPLRQFIDLKQLQEVDAQKAQNKVAQQDNWDVALTVGMHHSVTTPFQQGPGGYGGFKVSYNLGSAARDAALERSANAYGEYKLARHDDVAFLAGVLKKEVEESIATQDAALQIDQKEINKIDAHLAQIGTVDTNSAMSFANQLKQLDKLVVGVEISTAQLRSQLLSQYLTDNF